MWLPSDAGEFIVSDEIEYIYVELQDCLKLDL